MHSTLFFVALAALVSPLVNAQSNSVPVTGLQGNASVVTDNPIGLVYTATLPDESFFNPQDPRGNIKGSISATANPDGIGVMFQVAFSNLPTSGGPFVYHLHVDPVPSSGNCTDTLGHIDPFVRGEMPACDPAIPQTCQVGDLSGKHGAITSDPFTAQYVDEFASTQEGLGSYFGNRSFVIHFANVTSRITCANFVQVGKSTGASNSTGSIGGGNSTSSGGKSTGTSSPRPAATSTSRSRPTSTSTSSPARVTTSSASNVGASSMFALVSLMAMATLFL